MTEANVPEGWTVRNLGDLGHVKVGLTYKPENVSEFGTLVLRSSNIQNDRLAFQDNVFVDIPVGEGATVQSDDLLICVRNGSRKLIGKTTLIDKRADGMAFGAFMSAFRSELNHYLIWLFQSKIIQAQIEENLGATINQITNATLKRLRIPLPDDPKEQTAIAEALSNADAVIEGLERLIAKKRLIKQGAMQDLLTAKRRLPGFSGKWATTALRKLLKQAPAYGINASACPVGSGGFDYLRITDIDEYGQLRNDGRSEVLHPSSVHYFLQPDDIVVARTGASTGKSHQYNGPVSKTVFAGFLIKLTPAVSDVVPSYLFQFMQTDVYWAWVAENSARSGQPGINGQQLSAMEVFLPRDTKEQGAIAVVLNDMDTEIQALETRLDKARQVKEGMMQNLLTGRIRLV